jgi:hypothetical protein
VYSLAEENILALSLLPNLFWQSIDKLFHRIEVYIKKSVIRETFELYCWKPYTVPKGGAGKRSPG